MRHDFIPTVQAHIARTSISPSAIRGIGTRGSADCARKFLRSLPLKPFAVSNAYLFQQRLDAATDALVRQLPRNGRKWGRARKIINIFLRDALYSVYLRERFALARAEDVFELPLDRLTAEQLQERHSLPAWPGVARLTPEVSAQYQEAARIEGERWHLSRVHLDVYWYGSRQSEGGD